MLLKRKDVVAMTGLCYTTIYNLENQGGFPARRQLSPGRVAWMKDEVTAWLNSRGLANLVLSIATHDIWCFHQLIHL